jgi:hypothetical protein
MAGAVGVPGLGGFGGQLDECPCLVVGVFEDAGRLLGIGGQPGGAVQVPGLGRDGASLVSARTWLYGSVTVRTRLSARSGSPANAGIVY